MSERRQLDNNEDDPLVRLSVSGTPYTVRREVLAENDWILSKIVDDSDIPWNMFDEGRHFVDADPIAFRWALYFVRARSLPSELSGTELESVRSLADFLCFASLLKYIKRNLQPAQEDMQQLLSKDIADTKSDIGEMKRAVVTRIDGLEKKIDELEEQIESQKRLIRHLDCY